MLGALTPLADFQVSTFGAIYRYDGELVDLVGSHNLAEDLVVQFRREFPARPHRGLLAMRAIMDHAVVHVQR